MKGQQSLVKLVFVSILAAVVVAGCGGTKVERIETSDVRDLSGRWNDTDSRFVSEAMVEDLLSRPWLSRYNRSHNGPPAVIVGDIRNLSHEHISMTTFVNDIERALINSGKVDFVASRQERQDIREERKDMDIHAREDTRKEMGQEIGADYMLKGDISTILDQEGKQQVRYYQIDLTLISLADNRKVWIGQKKIKKFVTGSNLRP